MWSKASRAEQFKSSGDGGFGGLSLRRRSQRQLALSIKQFITQACQLKEELEQHTHAGTNTFRGEDTLRFISEVKPIINPKGLSIKRFLLTDKRSS